VTLYILKAVPSGLIKIGISDQFDRRLSAIRRQNSESVEVVRTYQGDSEYIRQLEKELHEELNAIRWQCEWFYGGSEVDRVVSRLDRDFNFTSDITDFCPVTD
jgi:Meiotically up-regulated gene 113